MWAAELNGGAGSAERGCAVGSVPLDEIPQYVPVRASVAINVGDGHLRLAVTLVGLFRRVWSWVSIGMLVDVIVQVASYTYSATVPFGLAATSTQEYTYTCDGSSPCLFFAW